jgi:signal transduction histidine kinase
MFSAGDRRDLSTVAGDAEGAGPAAEDRRPLIALGLARAIVAVVFCCFGAIAFLWVLESRRSPGEIALALACLSGLLGLQYFYFGRPGTDLRSPWARAVLAAQAGLVYLPLVVFGQGWVSQPSFLAGSVLLVLPLRQAWTAYAAIVAGAGVAQFFVDGLWLDVVYILVNTATAGLYVYGLTRLARLVTELHEARDELARTAVAHERLRFARDLHDLLELRLSAIAPKGELTVRLSRRNPERAKRELADILHISRRAMSDVRAIARRYRDTSLADETGTLASMLAGSNVELLVDMDVRELAPSLRTAIAAVLREGVAHVLRHQEEVTQCEIILRRHSDVVSVDILDDGAGARDGAPAADRAGGLGNLSATVAKMRGDLAAGVAVDGRFRIHVSLPVTARPPERPVTAAAGESKMSIPRVATRLAGGLVVMVLFGLFVQAMLRPILWSGAATWSIALGSASLVAVLVLQLAYFSRPGTRLDGPAVYLLLGLQAALVYLPWLLYQEALAGLQGFLAASALLALRPVYGWTVFAAVMASVSWAQAGSSASGLLPRDIGQILITLDIALIVYGLTWMARSVRRLRALRQRLAAAALARTRLRLAQDLHDLLGLSLSAITLKSELASRLLDRDPVRARVVLTELLEISRQALADVRSVAAGRHEMSVDEECRTAEALLSTAGLDVRMDVGHDGLPPEVGTVLAIVVREGVTNVLRHSKGERCEIVLRADEDGVRLRIVNDGVIEPIEPSEGDRWGSGIRNMSERVTALGGSLTAGADGDGRFLVSAGIPGAFSSPPPAPAA